MNRGPGTTGPASRKRHDWLPDFFIPGAMKCGTSTLHAILAHHPDIFMPPGELFFFDIDDWLEHADFYAWDGRRWTDRDFQGRADDYLAWYRGFFSRVRTGQLIGENSTTYLASPAAPGRIAAVNPDAKLIVMLRDPAERAYSTYWHLLRHGRIFHTFEDSLRLQPEALLSRSLYGRQLERWLRHFPREQIHIALLEDLAAAPSRVVDDVCRFLGLPNRIPPDALTLEWNRWGIPRFPRVQMWRNHLLWRHDAQAFLPRLPDAPAPPGWRSRLASALDRVHRRLNPLQGRPPPMRAETRAQLNRYFRRQDPDLAKLVGRDLDAVWYGRPGGDP